MQSCTQPTGQASSCGAPVPLSGGVASKTITPATNTGVQIEYLGTADAARSIGARQNVTVR